MEFRSWFVVVVVFVVPTVLQYSAVLFYTCSKQKHKADHGHKKEREPWAQEGHPSTGISTPRTEVLRTRTYFSAANTLLRNRVSRGHLNLYHLRWKIDRDSFVVRSWWSSFSIEKGKWPSLLH